MNLKELQIEVQAVSARLTELGNELGRIIGQVDGDIRQEAPAVEQEVKAGSVVRVKEITEEAGSTIHRCFTVGITYKVSEVDDCGYIEFEEDDEGDRHTIQGDELILEVVA